MVLFNYERGSRDELTIREGDVVTQVREHRQQGWLYGNLNGRFGLFPRSFVKLTTSCEQRNKDGGCFSVVAVFDSLKEHDGELGIVVGDVIEVVDTDVASGWWRGRCNGVEGIFPSGFVKRLHIVEGKVKTDELHQRAASESL